jgi:hypothetical protein
MGFKDDNTQSRICNHHPETCTCRDWDITEEPKQLIGEKVMPLDNDNIEEEEETLEEAANNFANLLGNKDEIIFGLEETAFIEGAKWQAERMYSEEDFKLFARQYYREIKLDKSNLLWDDLADKCLEQFKKK